MSNYTIIPSKLKYKSAPSVDQELSLSLEGQTQQITEYDRSQTISLAQVFDDERQSCNVFRPTFKVSYIYDNTYTGTTSYLPFQYNLYYVEPNVSAASGIWKGFPQFYEFDFYRPPVDDQHISSYKAKSAYTYNWTYYLSYAYQNSYDKQLYYNLNNTSLYWKASEGIPFSIQNTTQNGSGLISFQCIAPHGLSPNEWVQLSISYMGKNLFQVDSLGNDRTGSDVYIFNVYNVGFTGNTFNNGTTGTFKRVINPANLTETTSQYYVRQHKILTNVEDIVVTKAGFEKNLFNESFKLEYSSITPNQVTRVSQKASSNTYSMSLNYDLDLTNVLDNQKRPVTELFITTINKGFSGYFNNPNNGIGLKQGWTFNITPKPNFWWDRNNIDSNTNIPVSGYTLTSGVTKTFYYNLDLKKDDIIDGDFCEWNNYEQTERVVSTYYQKIKYNQNVFQTTNVSDTNSPGFYYAPHNKMTLKVFSDYVEVADVGLADGVPSYSYFSNFDQQFRWRDLYTYGFIDNLGRGVDYPFLNTAQYPFASVIFRLIPEGSNYNYDLLGTNKSIKPLIDGCE